MQYHYTENSLTIFPNFKSLAICLLTYLSQKFRHISYFDKHSSWHHACHQKFSWSRLEKAKPKWQKDKNDDKSLRRSRRQRLSVNQTHSCIFCLNISTYKKLHAFATINGDQSLRVMADELEHTALTGRLPGSIIRKFYLIVTLIYRSWVSRDE